MRHSIQIGVLLVLTVLGSRSLKSEEPPTSAPYDKHISRRSTKDVEPTAEEAEAIAKIERLLHRLAEDERKKQDYPAQLAAMRKQLKGQRLELDPHDPELIGTMLQLVDLLIAVEQYGEARQLVEKAAVLSREIHGQDHWQTTDVETRLTTIGKLTTATEGQRRDFGYARELLRIGGEFLDKQWFQQALACTMTAGKYRKQLLGDSPELAECIEQAGQIHMAAGKYLTGGIYYSGSAVMRRKTLGKDHPASIRSDELVRDAKQALKEHPDYVRELQERAVCELFGLDYEEMKPEFKEMRELDADRD